MKEAEPIIISLQEEIQQQEVIQVKTSYLLSVYMAMGSSPQPRGLIWCNIDLEVVEKISTVICRVQLNHPAWI